MRVAVGPRDGMLDNFRARFNSGIIRVYSGPRPATADTALSGNTVLAELTLGNPAFAASANGVLTANAITGDTAANNNGSATFARFFESDGVTVIGDGSVSASGGSGELQFANLNFVAGVPVPFTGLTITFPVGT